MINAMLNVAKRRFSYMTRGVWGSLGYDPTHRAADGTVTYVNKLLNAELAFKADSVIMPDVSRPLGKGFQPNFGAEGLATGAAMGVSALTVMAGYTEGGAVGAMKAMAFDVAVNSAVAHHAYTGTGALTGNKLIARNIGAAVGGAIGSYVGGPILGTPGAFIGAYIGAAPMKMAMGHPYLLGAAVVAGVGVGATRIAAKGSYEILKQGYQHAQLKRTIQTSGDLSAFMTQGATTMRERAVQSMSNSRLNARSALGREASFMHMPNRNYFSRYR